MCTSRHVYTNKINIRCHCVKRKLVDTHLANDASVNPVCDVSPTRVRNYFESPNSVVSLWVDN